MAQDNTGGQAFPVVDPKNDVSESGMTLRDWFAGRAINAAWDALDKGYYDGGNTEVARCAYQMADAMLKAREVSE